MKTHGVRVLRNLERRYREFEAAGHDHGLLAGICAAGGLALAGMAALAFVQTHAVLVLALGLTLPSGYVAASISRATQSAAAWWSPRFPGDLRPWVMCDMRA